MSVTVVVLVECDSTARARHESILISAGYDVIAMASSPDLEEVHRAAFILSDLPSLEWLWEQRIRGLPPLIAISNDVKRGITACLCGAAAWVPADGAVDYLLDTVHEVQHSVGRRDPPGEAPLTTSSRLDNGDSARLPSLT